MIINILSNRVQYLAITVSFLLLFFILFLIRNKKIKEEYSLLWLFFSLIFIVFSFWRNLLDEFAAFIGIAYPPAAFFLIFLIAVLFILIQFSVLISELSEKNKIVAQELAILKQELQELKSQVADNETIK